MFFSKNCVNYVIFLLQLSKGCIQHMFDKKKTDSIEFAVSNGPNGRRVYLVTQTYCKNFAFMFAFNILKIGSLLVCIITASEQHALIWYMVTPIFKRYILKDLAFFVAYGIHFSKFYFSLDKYINIPQIIRFLECSSKQKTKNLPGCIFFYLACKCFTKAYRLVDTSSSSRAIICCFQSNHLVFSH